jgi:hypothetical protein
MIIPNLPVLGAQQDSIKTKRNVQPTAETEPVHEHVWQVGERQQRDEGYLPDRRRNRARRKRVNERQDLADLPSKGLLVDIQV